MNPNKTRVNGNKIKDSHVVDVNCDLGNAFGSTTPNL